MKFLFSRRTPEDVPLFAPGAIDGLKRLGASMLRIPIRTS